MKWIRWIPLKDNIYHHDNTVELKSLTKTTIITYAVPVWKHSTWWYLTILQTVPPSHFPSVSYKHTHIHLHIYSITQNNQHSLPTTNNHTHTWHTHKLYSYKQKECHYSYVNLTPSNLYTKITFLCTVMSQTGRMTPQYKTFSVIYKDSSTYFNHLTHLYHNYYPHYIMHFV